MEDDVKSEVFNGNAFYNDDDDQAKRFLKSKGHSTSLCFYLKIFSKNLNRSELKKKPKLHSICVFL